VLEIFEVLGVACLVGKKLAAQRAVEVGRFAHARRLYEDVYRASASAAAFRALSSLNQRLWHPLAAAELLSFAQSPRERAELFVDLGK
jgi:hypothetical protein